MAKVVMRVSAGKGEGLFATCDIELGENILQETPIDDVSARSIKRFAGYDPALGRTARREKVLQRSGLPMGGGNYGLFTMASKINHSCCPNAEFQWNTSGALHIQALVDIKREDEITVSYLNTEHWGVRKQKLERDFDFVCACTACSVEDKRRDDAIRSASELQDKFASALFRDRDIAEQSLSTWIELICSHRELRIELPRSLYCGFKFACASQDRAAAEHYEALTLKYAALFHGRHSGLISKMEALDGDPAEHTTWGAADYAPSTVERLDVETMLGF